ncbi:MAG: hypothetical protein R3249_05455 [Nitriliruptorales bacterium]|nr:hypothetical protein [Nitriliruptorales bacterium]
MSKPAEGERPPSLHNMVNVDDLLELTERLREAHRRISDATQGDNHRRRWEKRLATISEVGTSNIPKALGMMETLEADIERLEGASG